jgi:hypothetical protein
MSRVAIYGGGGSPYNHAAILAEAGHDVRFVFPVDVKAGALESFDAFVMPGGAYLAMQGQLDPLGIEGCRAIREYVEAGGMYIGSCAGSYDAATVPPSFLEICPAQGELCLLESEVWNVGDSRFGVLESPGIGELIAENVDPAHPVMAGMPATFPITHYNGPFFSGGQALARVQGGTARFTPSESFLGGVSSDPLVDRAQAAGVANIVAGERGRGRVVLFGSHPEFGSSLSLDDTPASARLLTNAVAWQLDESGRPERPHREVYTDGLIDPAVVESDRAGIDLLVQHVAERCSRLRDRTSEPWLDDGAAMSMFGESPRAIWTAALDRLPELAAEAGSAAATMRADLLSFRSPQEWNVDAGYLGVYALLETVERQLSAAETQWSDSWPGKVTDPYDHMLESPYHLVAGSYLAAVGGAASAALLARMSSSTVGQGLASV